MNASKQSGGLSSKQRITPCCVPDARDLYQSSFDIEAIDAATRPIDNLADSGLAVFWDDTACFGLVM